MESIEIDKHVKFVVSFLYGLQGVDVKRLVGYDDHNFLISKDSNRWILKISTIHHSSVRDETKTEQQWSHISILRNRVKPEKKADGDHGDIDCRFEDIENRVSAQHNLMELLLNNGLSVPRPVKMKVSSGAKLVVEHFKVLKISVDKTVCSLRMRSSSADQIMMKEDEKCMPVFVTRMYEYIEGSTLNDVIEKERKQNADIEDFTTLLHLHSQSIGRLLSKLHGAFMRSKFPSKQDDCNNKIIHTKTHVTLNQISATYEWCLKNADVVLGAHDVINFCISDLQKRELLESILSLMRNEQKQTNAMLKAQKSTTEEIVGSTDAIVQNFLFDENSIIHGDLNENNILILKDRCTNSSSTVDTPSESSDLGMSRESSEASYGVIDFGDTSTGSFIDDLSTAIAYFMLMVFKNSNVSIVKYNNDSSEGCVCGSCVQHAAEGKSNRSNQTTKSFAFDLAEQNGKTLYTSYMTHMLHETDDEDFNNNGRSEEDIHEKIWSVVRVRVMARLAQSLVLGSLSAELKRKNGEDVEYVTTTERHGGWILLDMLHNKYHN